jgi:hypothetical protein
MVELADIFRRHGPDYRARFGHRMPTSHLVAMQDIAQCRTEALGGHVYQCTDCRAWAYRDHSCNNRHGPTCQHLDATRWLDTQRALLLPGPSFLVTFTLPEELRPLARSHQKLLSTLFFRTSSAALKDLALDPPYLGGHIGMLGVLHTWTRDMASHPHVHSLVPAAALAPTASRWLSPRYADWLVPVPALSTLFRGKGRPHLPQANLIADLPPHLWRQPWGTHGEPAGSGNQVIASLAPSIRRIALTNHRIEKLDDGRVTFRVKQSTTNQWQRRTRPAQECIRRFLQHVLPKGFIKGRDYGFLSPACRQSLTHIRQLLAASSGHPPARHDGNTRKPDTPHPPTQQARQCTKCRGPLVLIPHLSAPQSVPP